MAVRGAKKKAPLVGAFFLTLGSVGGHGRRREAGRRCCGGRTSVRSGGRLYVGISTDLKNRMRQHRGTLLYKERAESRVEAAKREREVKGWSGNHIDSCPTIG
jgi:hypothetical protein